MLKDILQKLLTVSAAATFVVGFSGTGAWADACKKECSHYKGEHHKDCMDKCESKTPGEEGKDGEEAKTPHDGHHTPHGHHHKNSDEAKS